MDLKRIVFVLFRHKFGIAALVSSSLLVVAAYSLLRTPNYLATAQILVKLGREISSPSQDILEDGGFVIQKRREDIYAEVEILNSLHVIRAVVDEIGHDTILHDGDGAPSTDESAGGLFAFLKGLFSSGGSTNRTPVDRAVDVVRANFGVEPVIRADTIRLTYSDPDRALAERILDTILAKFLERHIDVHKGGEMQSVFAPQAEHYRAALEEAEAKIAALKMEHGVFSLPAQRSELIREKMSIESKLADTRREIATLERKIERIEHQLESQEGIRELLGQEDHNPELDALRMKLVELKLDRESILQQFSNDSRDASAIAAEIKKVEQLLAKEQARVLYTNRKNLADLKVQEETLIGEIADFQRELETINDAEAQQIQLERERAINEQNYLRYVAELEEAQISAVMDLARITNVRVLQSAAASHSPMGPSAALLFALTIVLSLLASVGAAFVFDYLDHSISTAQDIEDYLELPVLGSIAEAGK